MKIITQRQLIQNVAKKWRKQYEPFKGDKPLFSWRTGATSQPINKQQIANALDKLDGNTATAKDVENIIGNDSWTKLKCHECNAETNAIVQVGEPLDFESRTVNLCADCVKKALELCQP